jgi:hypothetical protein
MLMTGRGHGQGAPAAGTSGGRRAFDSLEVKLGDMRTRLRTAASALLLLGGAEPTGSGKPPTSLAPPRAVATIRAAYTHQVTKECAVIRGKEAKSCSTRVEPSTGETSITLTPVPEASLRGRADTRSPLTISVQSGDGAGEREFELQPGVWRLGWKGYPRQPTFRAEAAGSLRLLLVATVGRCEPSPTGCVLVPSVVEKRADFRRR